MEENKKQTDHPWNTLSTVITFDRDNNPPSTLCESDTNRNPADGQVIQRITPTSVLVEALVKKLCVIFEKDRTRRNRLYFAICDKLHELSIIDSSYNMIEFEPFREQYQRALTHFISVARAASENDHFLRVPRNLMSGLSRYQREFTQINFIAKGGFGEVFKARHCLDGIEYAIKKIIVHSNRVETIKQHLEEVKTWAQLEHVNIVSYKAAWIEPTLVQSFAPTTPQNVSSRNRKLRRLHTSQYMRKSKPYNWKYNQTSPITEENINWRNILRHNKESCTTGHRVIEEINTFEYKEETSSDIVSFRNTENNEILDRNESKDSTDNSYSHIEFTSSQELCNYSSFNMNQHYMTLYIQMTLCEQTLQDWMCDRINATPVPVAKTVLEQLLCGINYIHSQNVVHHDIKPSNIFISTSRQLQIQLGDFGLACLPRRDSHNTGIGTPMYAAPEQLQGKCDPKSDIYSLGIVLTELLIPIKTQMELIFVINCLKRGDVPENLTADQHKWGLLIKQLVQEDPSTRPSAKQLLDNLNEDKDMIITELRNNVHEKDGTIQELQEKIALLEEKLKNLNIPSENI